jgi:hypothetical protein
MTSSTLTAVTATPLVEDEEAVVVAAVDEVIMLRTAEDEDEASDIETTTMRASQGLQERVTMAM